MEVKLPTSNKRSPRIRENKKWREATALRNNRNKYSRIEK